MDGSSSKRNVYLPSLSRNNPSCSVSVSRTVYGLKTGTSTQISDADAIRDGEDVGMFVSNHIHMVDGRTGAGPDAVTSTTVKVPKPQFPLRAKQAPYQVGRRYHFAKERIVGDNGERSKKLQTATEFYLHNYQPYLQISYGRYCQTSNVLTFTVFSWSFPVCPVGFALKHLIDMD